MPQLKKDLHTGQNTTGHEWNGISELDTPVPRVIWWSFGLTFLASISVWLLFPTWPSLRDYSRGVLGTSQASELDAQSGLIDELSHRWRRRVSALSIEEVSQSVELVPLIERHGSRLFEDNCAVCHGENGTGQTGYPNLSDTRSIWAQSPEEIYETLRVGINTSHPETRFSEMLAFGDTGILSADEVDLVAGYVASLSAGTEGADPSTISLGAEIYAQQCAACHGPTGQGNTALGAPDLTDQAWIYGGDLPTITASIRSGRKGQMPAWQWRLSDEDRKVLASYVLQFSDPEEPSEGQD